MTEYRTVDRVWPWIACFAAGLTNFLATGGTRSMGILFLQLQERFKTNSGIIGLVLGFTAAELAIFSVVGNVLGSYCGNRLVGVVGAALTFVSLLLTAFAPNIHFVVVTLGLSTGIGYGLICGPSMIVVGHYFNKHGAKRNGIAVAGGSLGQVVIPFLLVFFVNTFNFQGGIMLYAALALHAIPAALLLRPLKESQKVDDTITATTDYHTVDSNWTPQTRSNSHQHTSHERFSDSAFLSDDAGFSQNSPVSEQVSFDNLSWTEISNMNMQSFFDTCHLGLFGYSETKRIVTPAPNCCQESVQRCSDLTIEENIDQYKRAMQPNSLNNISSTNCCRRKSDEGQPPDIRERYHTEDHIDRIFHNKIDKYQEEEYLEEDSEATDDEPDYALLHQEYDILDEIFRECSIRQSVLQGSEDNVSERETQCSEFKNECSTRQTDKDVLCVADNQMPCLTDNFKAESKQSLSDVFKRLETSVSRIDFDIGESSDFNFSIGSLNFDNDDHKKKEKTSWEEKINNDFLTNSNNEGVDYRNGASQQTKTLIEHMEIPLQHKKKSKKHRETSEHREKSIEPKTKFSENRTKNKHPKIRPVTKQSTSTDNMERCLSSHSENNFRILNHSSDKLKSSEQHEMVNHSPKSDDLRNSVSNYTTHSHLNSDEWSRFLKSEELFSSNFLSHNSIKTSSTATLLFQDLDFKTKGTFVTYKHSSLPSNFKQPSFYKCCTLYMSKVFDKGLLTNWSYMLLATGLAVSHSGCMNGCFFLPVFAAEMGQSDFAMAVLVSIMGVADFLGRIAGSFCSGQHMFKVTTLLGSLMVVCGLLTVLTTLYPRLWVLVLYGMLHSLVFGAYTSMLVVALVEVVGIESLVGGITFSTILSGMFMLPTSSILGLVEEATGSFAQPLRICGLFLVAGGCIIIVEPRIQKFQSQQTSPSPQSKTTKCQNFRSAAVESFHFKLDNLILCKETVV